MSWIGLNGCGSGGSPTQNPSCSKITGTLQDSLTHLALANVSVSFESGTQLAGTPIYEFSIATQSTTGAQGNFALCAASVPTPSVVVATALDKSGNAYPPLVVPVSSAVEFGTLQMGGCSGTCGFPGEQQTSPPATINGAITTSPAAESGLVMPQYAISPLSGSPDGVWALTIPNSNASQPLSFTTTSSSCAAGISNCAAYSFSVPSQKPVTLSGSTYTQQTGVPVYSIYATTANPSSCRASFAFTSSQQNGMPLSAAPGADLSAESLDFSACH